MTPESETPASRPAPPSPQPAPRRRPLRSAAFAAALVGAAALGAGATALAHRGQTVLVALAPAPVAAMQDGSQVAVRGKVAEVFGKAFILADDSGRALVDTGPRGDRSPLVAAADTVTVQGRFEHGVVHAMALQVGEGPTTLLGPPGPPHGPWPFGPRP